MVRFGMFLFLLFFPLTLWVIYALGGFLFMGDLIFIGKKYKTEYNIDKMGQTVDYAQFVQEYSKSYLGTKKSLQVGTEIFDLISVFWNTEIPGWNPDPKTLQNKLVFWFFPSLTRRISGYNKTLFYSARVLNDAVTQILVASGNEIGLINKDNTVDHLQTVSVFSGASYYQMLGYMNKLTSDELLLVGIPRQAGNIKGSYKVILLEMKEGQ